MGQDDLLATRIERIAQWNGHLRQAEQAVLYDAVRRLRDLDREPASDPPHSSDAAPPSLRRPSNVA
jgi:hypothetical protein